MRPLSHQGLRAELEAAVVANTAPAYSNEPAARAQRSLKNTALSYLAKLKAPELVADAVARCVACVSEAWVGTVNASA